MSTLDAGRKRLGFLPNLHRLMSISPNAFAGWATLQDALKQTLDVRTYEGMTMAVSAVNACDHCIAAHSYVATTFTKPDELALNRKGTSSDPKRAVAIGSAKSLIERRGKVTDQDLDVVRAAGHTDQ
jgi:AhpD family alkylhydroperoxidase